MKFEQKYEIEKNGGLVLLPQGETHDYIFEGGFHGCGTTNHGIGIRRGYENAGAVMTLDDIVQLRNFLNKHLKAVLERSE